VNHGGTVQEKSDWLRAAIHTLPVEQRDVVALKIDGELTFGEIGAALGISPNTAASRYRYALEKLRTMAPREPVE
jgi:RNA polymerase sigma-70 factor (ECF subfamily)